METKGCIEGYNGTISHLASDVAFMRYAVQVTFLNDFAFQISRRAIDEMMKEEDIVSNSLFKISDCIVFARKNMREVWDTSKRNNISCEKNPIVVTTHKGTNAQLVRRISGLSFDKIAEFLYEYSKELKRIGKVNKTLSGNLNSVSRKIEEATLHFEKIK
jgi:hypothetical protein